MQIFYSIDIQGNQIFLDQEESRHCLQVLRHTEGDEILITDGNGNRYISRITTVGKHECIAEIISTEKNIENRPYKLHMAVAPTKSNERFEWFLEKATEIGIDMITPLICEHSERRVVKHDRMQKVLITALKQCGRTHLPVLNEATTFNSLITAPTNSLKLIARHDATQALSSVAKQQKHVLILIGPEGDFSDHEIELSIKHNFTKVGLGEFRLRTETAALAACHTIALLNALGGSSLRGSSLRSE